MITRTCTLDGCDQTFLADAVQAIEAPTETPPAPVENPVDEQVQFEADSAREYDDYIASQEP